MSFHRPATLAESSVAVAAALRPAAAAELAAEGKASIEALVLKTSSRSLMVYDEWSEWRPIGRHKLKRGSAHKGGSP